MFYFGHFAFGPILGNFQLQVCSSWFHETISQITSCCEDLGTKLWEVRAPHILNLSYRGVQTAESCRGCRCKELQGLEGVTGGCILRRLTVTWSLEAAVEIYSQLLQTTITCHLVATWWAAGTKCSESPFQKLCLNIDGLPKRMEGAMVRQSYQLKGKVVSG